MSSNKMQAPTNLRVAVVLQRRVKTGSHNVCGAEYQSSCHGVACPIT